MGKKKKKKKSRNGEEYTVTKKTKKVMGGGIYILGYFSLVDNDNLSFKSLNVAYTDNTSSVTTATGMI